MRTINSQIISELQSGSYIPFVLVHISLDGTDFYFTDCDIPIPESGNLYQPRGMEMGEIDYSLGTIVDSATITIDNTDDVLTSSFVGGTPQGNNMTISFVCLDSDYKVVVGAIEAYPGEIDEWSLLEGKIEITIVHKLLRWNRITLNRHQSSCRFIFKGAACSYSGGGSWCDGSYARCAALGNTANFGGFRWLPSIEQKDFWWGREREAG